MDLRIAWPPLLTLSGPAATTSWSSSTAIPCSCVSRASCSPRSMRPRGPWTSRGSPRAVATTSSTLPPHLPNLLYPVLGPRDADMDSLRKGCAAPRWRIFAPTASVEVRAGFGRAWDELDCPTEEVECLDPLASESPLLAGICGASVLGRVATGPRASQLVLRVGRNRDAALVASSGERKAHFIHTDQADRQQNSIRSAAKACPISVYPLRLRPAPRFCWTGALCAP